MGEIKGIIKKNGIKTMESKAEASNEWIEKNTMAIL
jgi:hypothetical protein